jgi:hypothetical protein
MGSRMIRSLSRHWKSRKAHRKADAKVQAGFASYGTSAQAKARRQTIQLVLAMFSG